MNFAEPITLNNYLNQHYPDWRNHNADDKNRRNGLMKQFRVSNQVMVNINRAAAVNAMNLTVSILLSSRQRALSKSY
ncbi:hypothetical protein INT80_11070 [Gallibacterium anatis]|uniref:GPAT/DHAPAT C-terminal domain-containing protein n=1 Tax=Gallibacterium anatis TaxID=750 RepID=A0A930UV95_9PAST|nr:hypothetical protein [Gallibacterium anatis]